MSATEVLCDATPQYFHENCVYDKKTLDDRIVNEISSEQYISMFFLLQDYIKIDFLFLTKQSPDKLKLLFLNLYNTILNEKILVEIFGTMKMYKHLKFLNSCSHIYKVTEKEFNIIDKTWKFLYSLCEEITDEDLRKLKQRVDSFNIEEITSAEYFFYYAYQNGIISKYDLSQLKKILFDFPTCLNLLRQYEAEPKQEFYLVRTPTKLTPCGIAVIYDFKHFNENSGLSQRDGSEIDVDALVNLWEAYGFKTRVFPQNQKYLSEKEARNSFKELSVEDHSKYDAFVCCILSHGKSNAIYTSDGKMIPILELIAPITNNCRTLNSKPKLFIIQACQGERLNSRMTVSSNIEESFIHPQVLDVCIIISTLPGYVSYRDKKDGGWFIQTLKKVMLSFKKECEILKVMNQVTKELKDKKIVKNGITLEQISPAITTLTKTLILKRVLNNNSFENVIH